MIRKSRNPTFFLPALFLFFVFYYLYSSKSSNVPAPTSVSLVQPKKDTTFAPYQPVRKRLQGKPKASVHRIMELFFDSNYEKEATIDFTRFVFPTFLDHLIVQLQNCLGLDTNFDSLKSCLIWWPSIQQRKGCLPRQGRG